MDYIHYHYDAKLCCFFLTRWATLRPQPKLTNSSNLSIFSASYQKLSSLFTIYLQADTAPSGRPISTKLCEIVLRYPNSLYIHSRHMYAIPSNVSISRRYFANHWFYSWTVYLYYGLLYTGIHTYTEMYTYNRKSFTEYIREIVVLDSCRYNLYRYTKNCCIKFQKV